MYLPDWHETARVDLRCGSRASRRSLPRAYRTVRAIRASAPCRAAFDRHSALAVSSWSGGACVRRRSAWRSSKKRPAFGSRWGWSRSGRMPPGNDRGGRALPGWTTCTEARNPCREDAGTFGLSAEHRQPAAAAPPRPLPRRLPCRGRVRVCHRVVRLVQEEDVLVTKLQVTSALFGVGHAAPFARAGALRRWHLPAHGERPDAYRCAALRRSVRGARRCDASRTPLAVHFHVPVSESRVGNLATTRSFLEEISAAQRARPFTNQLEVETYTFDVLPSALRGDPAEEIICQGTEWTRALLRA